MTNGTQSSQWPAHINALYQEDTTQLRFMKRQQWMLTNYLLILLGGIFAIARAVGFGPDWAVCIAIGMIFIAAAFTIVLLIIIQTDMVKPRKRLAEMYRMWSVDEREQFGLTTEPTGWQKNLLFLLPLLLVCLFGGAVVIYAIIYFTWN